MDPNVPKFNLYFPGLSLNLEKARAAFESAVRANPLLSDLAGVFAVSM